MLFTRDYESDSDTETDEDEDVPEEDVLRAIAEADGKGSERAVATDLVLQEVHKTILEEEADKHEERNTAARASSNTRKKRTRSKPKRQRESTRKSSTRKKKKNKKSGGRTSKKIPRFNNITGEPSKEFIEKNKNVWRVQRIERDKRKRGLALLSEAASLDQYIIESFPYSQHKFALPYRFPEREKHEERRDKDSLSSACRNEEEIPLRECASFQEELARRWIEAHPNVPIEYITESDQRKIYRPDWDTWETLPWNRPSEWFLDISKLIEDDTICILKMLDEATIDAYKTLIETLPLDEPVAQ